MELKEILDELTAHAAAHGAKNSTIKLVVPDVVLREFSKSFEAFDHQGRKVTGDFLISKYHTEHGTVELFSELETDVKRRS